MKNLGGILFAFFAVLSLWSYESTPVLPMEGWPVDSILLEMPRRTPSLQIPIIHEYFQDGNPVLSL